MATCDILAFPSIASQYGSVLVFSITKLAQRFLLELLTPKGSLQYLPERGCEFINALRRNALSEVDIQIIFTQSLVSITKNLTSEDKEIASPLDEQFRSAVVKNIQISPGAVALTVEITTQAGVAIVVTTPPLTVIL